jgi:hypothetical protein
MPKRDATWLDFGNGKGLGRFPSWDGRSAQRSSDAIVYQHYRVPACKEWERGFPSGLSSPRFALCSWALDMLPVEIQLLQYLP